MYLKNVRLLSIFNFLIGLTFFAPLAIIYFAKVSGSYTLGTSVFGIIMLSAALFEVPTGIWSDRVGRKQTIVYGSVARVLAFIFYAIGLSYWFLVIGAILEGISRALYSGNNEAFLFDTLADENKENEYKKYLGKTSSYEHIGLAISAAVGGLIATISFSYVMWLAVLSQVLMFAISLQFIEPRSRREEGTNVYAHLKEALALFFTNKKLRLLSLASILENSFGELAYQFRGAFYNTIWPLWAIGLTNIFSHLLVSVGLHSSDKILGKMKAETAVFLKSFLDRVVSLISLIFPTILSPFIMSGTSLLYGLGLVAESELRQKEYKDNQRATMNSLVSLGRAIGAAVMTVVLGKTADTLGPRQALIMMALLSFSVTAIYWVIRNNVRKS
jgi:MFS family permease